jgi:hypothetical protein
MKRFIILAAFVIIPLSLRAQNYYYGSDFVIEKSFDARDYFLRPHRILGLNLKNLDAGLLGILPDPLSDMSFQPALLSSLAGSRLYIDLKGKSDSRPEFEYDIYPTYYYDNARFVSPYFAAPAKRKLEPLVSAIYVGDIAAKYLPGFKFALSYELIHHQGTFYEYVPFWHYGAYDAFGRLETASRDFPEIDPNIKQDGLDDKTETAHLFDGYLSLKLADFLSVGAKVSRAQTDVSGDYARLNNYDDPHSNSYRSGYLTSRNTGAALRQNELSAGAVFSFSEARQIGFFAGRIDGDHQQSAAEVDTSYYAYGTNPQEPYFARSRYSHQSASRWRHEGSTKYAGVHGQLPVRNDIAFRFRVEYQKSAIDLTNGNTVLDTSAHRYRWQQNNGFYDSQSSSRFDESRNGAGDENITQKSAALGLVVPIYRHSQITVGLFAEISESKLLVYEEAQVRRSYNQETPTPWSAVESIIGIEDKTLRLDKTSATTRLALPVAMSLYLGRGWTAHVGAIKEHVKIETDEVIDIWFRTDSKTTIRPDSIIVDNPPERIDRYRSAPLQTGNGSTNFRFGLSFQPGQRVRIDVGMGSKLSDLERWQFAVLLNL